ncbi:hypothetical protein O1L44_28390 [Streptomyces noursei]|nr:hypothetical protein [Streptomyces noursei]
MTTPRALCDAASDTAHRVAELLSSPERVAGAARGAFAALPSDVPPPAWQPASLLLGTPASRCCTPGAPGTTHGTRRSGTPISRPPWRRPPTPARPRSVICCCPHGSMRTPTAGTPGCWRAPPRCTPHTSGRASPGS